jgi:hypothetical protein
MMAEHFHFSRQPKFASICPRRTRISSYRTTRRITLFKQGTLGDNRALLVRRKFSEYAVRLIVESLI